MYVGTPNEIAGTPGEIATLIGSRLPSDAYLLSFYIGCNKSWFQLPVGKRISALLMNMVAVYLCLEGATIASVGIYGAEHRFFVMRSGGIGDAEATAALVGCLGAGAWTFCVVLQISGLAPRMHLGIACCSVSGMLLLCAFWLPVHVAITKVIGDDCIPAVAPIAITVASLVLSFGTTMILWSKEGRHAFLRHVKTSQGSISTWC